MELMTRECARRRSKPISAGSYTDHAEIFTAG